jgi:hypothetical protein
MTKFQEEDSLYCTIPTPESYKNAFLIVQPTRCHLPQIIYFTKALHVSGGTSTHHQEFGLCIQLLVFVKPCCYLLRSWLGLSTILMMGGCSIQNMHSVFEINELRKVTSCWLYLKNIFEDARTYKFHTYKNACE